jgi:ferredoxin
VKVRVDINRCEGTGYCEAINDHVFALTDQGVAEVLIPDDDTRLKACAADLREAESLCPTGAITVIGD